MGGEGMGGVVRGGEGRGGAGRGGVGGEGMGGVGRGGEGWGGERRGGMGRGSRGGEGANKVLQPAQSVRLRASIIVCNYYAVVFKGEMRIALLTFAHYDTECYIMHAPFRT